MTAWFRFLYFRSAARRTVFPLLLAVCLVSCASAPESVPETEADNGQTVSAPAESAPSAEVPAGMPETETETETEAEMEAEAEAPSAESPSGVSASDESLETGSDGNSPASPAVPPLFSPDEDLSGLAADEPGVTVLPGWTAPVTDSGTAPQETPPADGVRSLAENAAAPAVAGTVAAAESSGVVQPPADVSPEAETPAAQTGESAAVSAAVLPEEMPVPESGPESAPSAEPESEPEPDAEPEPEPEPEPLPGPSRSLSVHAGQNVEVWYPGRGWVFLGFREDGAAGGVTFGSRRFAGRDTVFFFRTGQPGRYMLEFSRFDVLFGGHVEDVLELEVLPGPAGSSAEQTVRAPDYAGLSLQVLPDEEPAPDNPEPAAEESGEPENAGPDSSGVDALPADAVTAESGSGIPGTEEETGSGEPSARTEPENTAESGNAGQDAPPVMFPPADSPAEPDPAPVPESAGTRNPEAALSAAEAAAGMLEEPAVSVTAPDTDAAADTAPAADTTSAAEGDEPVPDTGSADSSGPESGTEDLAAVRAMLDRGEAENALAALDAFFAGSAGGTDEALFLQGQAYEADSPRRNIRKALSCYEILTQTYPLSRFWDAADRRIRYIRRFYFDIR